MYIRLIRNEAKGNAITGRLVINGRWFCYTLERKGVEIPALCYHVCVTQSPKFKRLLPLVCGVPSSVESCRIVQNGVELCRIVQNGVELCRVVRSGVESSSAERTTLHNSTQPLHNSTQLLPNTTQPLHKATLCAMRSGIRFHRGSKPEHSTGCILVVADNWRGVEWCRMVQSGVESSSVENTTLPNTTQLLHDATQPLHNSTLPKGRTAADVEHELTQLILKAQKEHEEIILEVTYYKPGTEYGYNTPCPCELQKP